MKNFIICFSLLISLTSYSQVNHEYFKEGYSDINVEKCAFHFAFQKMRQRGLTGIIKITGKVDKPETNRPLPNNAWDLFNDDGRIALIFVTFEGIAGNQEIKGKIGVYAQKSTDEVFCKLGTHNQLPIRGQRRFLLLDKKTGNEID